MTDGILITLISFDICVLALILPIYRFLGRIEGILNNGIVERIEKLEEKIDKLNKKVDYS